MKRILGTAFCALLLCGLLSGCQKTAASHSLTTQSSAAASGGAPAGALPVGSGALAEGKADVYPYDIAADRDAFNFTWIDITVGDNLYATQLNDWYTNFEDYEGKSVRIEGHYLSQDGYLFVGRKGPTCPYCVGEYVAFEFDTDADLSTLVSEESWVRITGILRQGSMRVESSSNPLPFYYIEAMAVEPLATVGKGTVTN